MSVKALSVVWDESRASGSALLVLLAMADWADQAGRCHPSYLQLARKTRLSRSSVLRATAELEQLGEIERISRGQAPTPREHDDEAVTNIRAQHRNSYRILLVGPRRSEVVSARPHKVGSDSTHPVGSACDQQVGAERDHPSPQVASERHHHPPTGADRAEVGSTCDHLERTGGVNDASQVVSTTTTHKRIRPSEGPSGRVQAGAAPRSTHETDPPDRNLGVITKIAHVVMDEIGEQHEDVAEAVKALCAQRHIAYDATIVRTAIDSARVQRGLQRRRRA